jgi:hypothetical protein
MADEDKLVKAGVEAALKPFADLLEKLAGPAAEEIGLTFKDHVRVFRFKRQLRLFKTVDKMLADAGLEPGRVPLKTLSPIIESASLEEDDGLQDRWAALLANAAVMKNAVHPSYAEILKQLNSLEVLALDVVERKMTSEPNGGISKGISGKAVVSEMAVELCGGDERAIEYAARIEKEFFENGYAENLSRLGLMTIVYPRGELWVGLTLFGKKFILACRPPSGDEV